MIWQYLSYADLLQNIDLIDLEDKEKLLTVEMATHEKNYQEEELFTLYERFKFNINQLLTVEESYKLLSGSESRALVYQGILITKETPEKIKLIKLLKDLFIKDKISEAFDSKLVKFLESMDETEIPSDYTGFYNSHKKTNIVKNNEKIKFNNKIIHQSKILDYFIKESDSKSIEKDLENLFKKIKKDKNYFFSMKDLIILESLKSDEIEFPKKTYEYEVLDPNIPYDIQILINREEPGLALLRLVEIIGEDNVAEIDSDTIYFIISVLNQLNLDRIRNNILLKVLPLKV